MGTMRARISGRIPHEVVACRRSVDPPIRRQSGFRRARVGAGGGRSAHLDEGGPMKRVRWIALVGAALAVALTTAGTAAGSNQHGKGGGYAVTGARFRPARRRADHRSEPRQRLGHLGRPDDPLVGLQRGHRHLDALRRGRHALPAAAQRAARREGPRWPDRPGLLRRDEVPRSQRHGERDGALHLRHARRHDPGLAPGHGRHGDRRRRLEVGRRLHRPRGRGRLAVRGRLQATAASTSSTATGST